MTSPSTSSAPGGGRDRRGRATASTSSWPSPRMPEADDLAGQQLRRADRREQHLDDARGLLLHHAHGHQVAEADQLAVEDQDGEEGEAAALLGGAVDRLDGRDRQRRRGSARRAAARSRPASRSASAARTSRLAACRRSTSSSSGSSCARIARAVSDRVDVAVAQRRVGRRPARPARRSTSASNAPAPRAAAPATGSAAGSATPTV